jgi:hypothetical protein
MPGGPDAHQVQATLPGDLGRHFLSAGGMLAQHLLHGLGLMLNGIVHEVRVLQADFRLLRHGGHLTTG